METRGQSQQKDKVGTKTGGAWEEQGKSLPKGMGLGHSYERRGREEPSCKSCPALHIHSTEFLSPYNSEEH